MSDLDLKIKYEYEKVNNNGTKGLKYKGLYFVLLIIFSSICLISSITYCWYKMFFVNPDNVLNTISMTMAVTLYDSTGNEVSLPNQESTDTNYYTTTDWILNEPSKTKITRYLKLDNTSTVDINAYLQFYMNYEEGSIGEARYNNIVKTSYFYIENITEEVETAGSVANCANTYTKTVSELNAIEGKLSMADIDKLQILGSINNDAVSYYRVEIWSTSTSVTLSSFGMATYIYSRVSSYDQSTTPTTYSVSDETALKQVSMQIKSGDIINFTSNISMGKPLTFNQAVTVNLNGYSLEVDGDFNYDYASAEDSYLNLTASSRLIVLGDINIDIPSSSLFITGNSKAQIIVGKNDGGTIKQGKVNIKTKYDKTQDESGYVQKGVTINTMASVDAYGNVTHCLADYTVLSNTSMFIGSNCKVGTIHTYNNAVNFKLVNEGEIEAIDASSVSFNSDEYDMDVWDGTSSTTFIGNGTIIEPYYISTCAQLKYFADQVNGGESYSGKYFELASDLDLNGFEWVPIGSNTNPFAGTFDSNAYLVSNYKITTDAYTYAGLFGYVTGTIKNAGITGASITINTTSTNAYYVGGLVGFITGGKVNGCYVVGNVSINTKGEIIAGSLIGKADGNLDVTNCYTNVTLTASSEQSMLIGGLVGQLNDGTISACYSTGLVTTNSTGNNGSCVGGLVGENKDSLKLSYSTSPVVANTSGYGYLYVGGLVGSNNSQGIVTICYSSGTVNSTVTVSGSGISVGGVVGYSQTAVSYVFAMGNINVNATNSTVGSVLGTSYGTVDTCFGFETQVITKNGVVTTGDNTQALTGDSTLIMANLVQPYWHIYGEGSIPNGYVWWVKDGIPPSLYYQKVTSYTITIDDNIWYGNASSAFGGGEGTQEVPYEISTGAHLAYLRDTVNAGNSYSGKYFILANNIDMNGNEWIPIGLSSASSFGGNFDGKGFKIFNYKITESYSGYYGLFGYMTNARIVDLTITNINYVITSSVDTYVGGLIGWANGVNIKNCEIKGTITVTSSSGKSCVGSLVGYYDGNPTVDRVDTSVTITVNNNSSDVQSEMAVGGLIGHTNSITATNCKATGDITAISKQAFALVGGLIGTLHNSGTIKFSDAACKIIAESGYNYTKAGGLVGNLSSTTVAACFANVNLSSRGYFDLYSGALIGHSQGSSTITDSYSIGISKAYFVGSGTTYKCYSGGLVGYSVNGATITKSFSRATVQAITITGIAYGGGLVGYNQSSVIGCYASGDVTGRGGNTTNSYVGGCFGYNSGSLTGVYRFNGQFLTRYIIPNTYQNQIGTAGELTDIYLNVVMTYFRPFDATNTLSVDDGYVWFMNQMHPYLYHEIVELIDDENVDKYNTAVLIGGSYERNKYQIFIYNRALIGLNNTTSTGSVITVPENSTTVKVAVFYILDKYYLSYSSTLYFNGDENYPMEERLSGSTVFTYNDINYISETDTDDTDYTDDGSEDTSFNSAYDNNNNLWKFIALENDTARLIDVELYDLTATTLDIPVTLRYRENDYAVSSVATGTINDNNVASLTQINIGANITNLQVKAFNSMQITNITLNSANTSYVLNGSLDDGTLALISADSTTLCEIFIQNGAITEYTLPFSILNIKYDAVSSIPTLKTFYTASTSIVNSSEGTFGTLYTLHTDVETGEVWYEYNGLKIHVLENLMETYKNSGTYNGYSEAISSDIQKYKLADTVKNTYSGTMTVYYYSSRVRNTTITGTISTVYFINTKGWDTVYCTAYLESYYYYSRQYRDCYLNSNRVSSTFKPGSPMTNTNDTYNGYEVWSIDLPEGCTIQFNNGTTDAYYTTAEITPTYSGGTAFMISNNTSTYNFPLSQFQYQVTSEVDVSGSVWYYRIVEEDGTEYAKIMHCITSDADDSNISLPTTLGEYAVLPGTTKTNANIYCYSETEPSSAGNYYYIDSRGRYIIWMNN